jgi:hypothetical protein
MKTCGLDGVIGEGGSFQPGFPPKLGTGSASSEEELANYFATLSPNPRIPVFYNVTCIAGDFCPGNRGYAAIVRQVNRIELAHPDRYVFLLPKDQFATIRNYYHLENPADTYTDLSTIVGHPKTNDGLMPVNAGDGDFKIVEHDGASCWLLPKHTPPQYFYLAKDKKIRLQPHSNLEIELEYLDAGTGDIGLEYDSSDLQAADRGAYKANSHYIHRTNTGQWKSDSFQLNDALFVGRQNGGADFRFYNGGDDLLIRAVRVSKP